MIVFVLLYIATAYMIFAASRRDQYAVCGAILMFCIMIAFFASLKVLLVPHVLVNVTLIFSAAYISSTAILSIDFGYKYVLRSAITISKWLVYVQVCILLMNYLQQQFTTAEPNGFRIVFALLYDNTVIAFFATYTSLVISTTAIAAVTNNVRGRRFYVYMLATTLAYTSGSVAFYFMELHNDPDLVQITVTSIAVKILMSAIYYPMIKNLNIAGSFPRTIK
jgi:hypothetical protein